MAVPIKKTGYHWYF